LYSSPWLTPTALTTRGWRHVRIWSWTVSSRSKLGEVQSTITMRSWLVARSLSWDVYVSLTSSEHVLGRVANTAAQRLFPGSVTPCAKQMLYGNG